ncbi:hypothetical protein P1P68_11175 [Streptomyces scabiei]|uniref:hypothetical protein n=1 Tax=Streptomyces scabiei TaxID=1930 RepID=UPI00299012EB|nr:hypothetical protein [Streptomyces scabiei]MDW8805326.1 hypothetical protein [Streptomyces scabiei]
MRLRTLPIITAIDAATFVGAAAGPAQAGTGLLLAVQINNFQDWGDFNQDPHDFGPRLGPLQRVGDRQPHRGDPGDLKACNTKAGFAPKNCNEDDTVA